MQKLMIRGGKPLNGCVDVQGSKNAVLPILSACLLVSGKTYLSNVPKLSDVMLTLGILEGLGCVIHWEDDVLVVDASNITTSVVKSELASKIRSSITLLGALISRCGEATINYPGGCFNFWHLSVFAVGLC